jgi:hypothetical protein
VGMYIHQHWSYNHPYAASTRSLQDWRGYLDGRRCRAQGETPFEHVQSGYRAVETLVPRLLTAMKGAADSMQPGQST